MAKFNVVQKKRRTIIAQRKRLKHGDPLTGKIKDTSRHHVPVSGKRKQKLLKKWRRDQKEAIEKGLVKLQDVEMAAADGEGSSKDAEKTTGKFHVKKKSVKLKSLKRKGKKDKKSKPAATVSVDAMVE